MNVSGFRRNIKNFAHSYSDAQVKVREATSNDPWGPSSTLMAEIADMTYNVMAFSEIMSMIWKRTNDHGRNWRHVYKALVLLEYLIKAGSEKVVQQCKENIYAIQTLREFQYYEDGKDQGVNIREKAKNLVALLKDEQKLKDERAKSLASKERFTRSNTFGSNPSLNTASAAPAPRLSNEIEGVRPSTEDEEELQLQLALAMSREEAEAEEAKRRSDDVRLQMALSQSQQDFVPEQRPKAVAPPQSNLVDLLDISFDAPVPVAQAPVPNWNQHVDPWKANADAWDRTPSVESSPAHSTWNTQTNNNNWGQTKEPWMEDPFKVDPWVGSSNNTQNNNDMFGSNHSSPFKQANPTAASNNLFDLDYLMKPAAPPPAMPSTNPFADPMFQTPPQPAPRTIDPWANIGATGYPHPQNSNHSNPPQYNFEMNNNNNTFDDLIVNPSRNTNGQQQGNNLYPNLNGNSGARKVFVE